MILLQDVCIDTALPGEIHCWRPHLEAPYYVIFLVSSSAYLNICFALYFKLLLNQNPHGSGNYFLI